MVHASLVLESPCRGQRREGPLREGETALVFPVGDPAVPSLDSTAERERAFRS